MQYSTGDRSAWKSTPQYRKVLCITEKYSAVQKSTPHYREVLRSTEKYPAVSKVLRSTEKYSAVQKSTLQYRNVLCSTEKYSAVQKSTCITEKWRNKCFPRYTNKKSFFQIFFKIKFSISLEVLNISKTIWPFNLYFIIPL